MEKYEQRLDYLQTLKTTAKIFGYLNSNLAELEKQHVDLYNDYLQNEKKVFFKFFNRSLYNTRKNNLVATINRIAAIENLLDANPDKSKDFTLNELLQQAIEKTEKHFTTEKATSNKNLANSKSYNVLSLYNIRINEKPENLYFKDKIINHTTPEKTTKQKNNTIVKNNDREM